MGHRRIWLYKWWLGSDWRRCQVEKVIIELLWRPENREVVGLSYILMCRRRAFLALTPVVSRQGEVGKSRSNSKVPWVNNAAKRIPLVSHFVSEVKTLLLYIEAGITQANVSEKFFIII